jgi:hypothetical protein
MARLTGIVLKQLIDVSMPEQPRWVGRTITEENVLIQYDHGTLMVKFAGDTEDYVENVNTPDDSHLTTEVMLLLTGIRVL